MTVPSVGDHFRRHLQRSAFGAPEVIRHDQAGIGEIEQRLIPDVLPVLHLDQGFQRVDRGLVAEQHAHPDRVEPDFRQAE